MKKPRNDAKVDHVKAANCRAVGMTLTQIRDSIAPTASLMAVSRALRRARRLEAADARTSD